MIIKLVSALMKVPKLRPTCLYLINTRSCHVLAGGKLWRAPYVHRRVVICRVGGLQSKINAREIQVTVPRRALPPIIVILLRPLTKLLAAISGRYVRKWWRKLTPEQKKLILNRIRQRKVPLLALALFVLLAFANYYNDHIVQAPLTGRKRFMMMDDDTVMQLSGYMQKRDMSSYRSDIVPVGHPFYQRTARVVNALIYGNRDIPEISNKKWMLTVVDRPEILNAFCYPDGHIFVFTGILNVCSNEHQLAVVISHEISHVILSHVAETISKTLLIEILLFLPSFVCWFLLTDVWAFMTEWMRNTVARVVINLPFSRSIEREADVVGLFIAAKACFDVREAPRFWEKMNIVSDMSNNVEWLSTHPSCETRIKDLHVIMPKALEVSEKSNCQLSKWFRPLSSFS